MKRINGDFGDFHIIQVRLQEDHLKRKFPYLRWQWSDKLEMKEFSKIKAH
ncbi:hypothetical protein EYZ11_012419 [Aspergillus tanneri]|uniref:Uncharacterized protein n=1 Tax=Aspergillus tanneri TaxID=1220188 RepID=A0A4S3J0B2_9EURO|nr:hypothetical protein EYZ11_012419 [Aspergillus tanneri]